jgi:cold-inducible RNA-binding protein
METKLYVGNLSFDVTENDLQDVFAQHGSVTDVNLIVDKISRRPRGFGFVTMDSKETAAAAIQALHGSQWHGRTMTVNEARPREERPAFAGGGARGGGSGERSRRY